MTATRDDHTVRVEGAEIRFRVRGEGRRDLLLVHGSGAHSGWWHAMVPRLAADWRVITPDLSGHGDSEHRAEYSGRTWASELLAVLDAVGSTEPVVAAHSLGGRVALLAADREPVRFAALVLLDSGIWAPPGLAERLARRTARSGRVYPTYAAARERFAVLPPQPQPPAAVLDPVAEYGLRRVEGGWMWKQDPNPFPPLYEPEVAAAAAALRVPVTYVSGELSRVVPPELAERVAAHLPNPRTVVLPGMHHHLPLEAPDECAREIDRAFPEALAAPKPPRGRPR